ncbi:MAG: GNAT family N-acetyltransferase [Methylophaga sp.]
MAIYERATEADIPELSNLLSHLFTQEVEFQPNDSVQRQGLSAIITNPNVGAILLARDKAQVIAMVNLLFTVSTALGGRVAILEDMIVVPAARGMGIGSALLSYALEFAKHNEVKRITLLTDRENHPAQQFYSQHGFEPSTMTPYRLTIPIR